MILNIAEALCRKAGNKQLLLRAAHGSIAEVCACMDTILTDTEDIKNDCRRIGQMIEGLMRKAEGRPHPRAKADTQLP